MPRVFRSRYVVITVPIGVLKANEIKFIPEVFESQSPKGQALFHLRAGMVSKVVLEFYEDFWEKQGGLPDLGFVHAPELAFPTWWGALPLHSPILTGWAGGPASERLVKLSRDQIIDRALTSLGQIFHRTVEDLRERLKCCHYNDWSSDRFSRSKRGSQCPGV